MAMFISLVTTSTQAQTRHLYSRVELGSGNAWSFLSEGLIAIVANELIHYPLFEATMHVAVPNSEYGNLNTLAGFDDWNTPYEDYDNEHEYYGFAKISAKNFFADITAGGKIGYLSDLMGSFNWCAYGSAHYKILQFRQMSDIENYTRLNTQRFQIGGGMMMILGNVEKNNRYIIDAGLRYNIPAYFGISRIDIEGTSSDFMNSGISSHYKIMWSYKAQTSLGIYGDVMHYNLFKNQTLCGSKSKVTELGFTMAIMFDAFEQ